MWFRKGRIEQLIRACQRDPASELLKEDLCKELRSDVECLVRSHLRSRMKRNPNEQDVHDIATDVLTKIPNALQKLEEPGKWRSWLDAIVQHTVIDSLRKEDKPLPKATWERLRGIFINDRSEWFHHQFSGQETAWEEICDMMRETSYLIFLHRKNFRDDPIKNNILKEVKADLRRYRREYEKELVLNGTEDNTNPEKQIISELEKQEHHKIYNQCFRKLRLHEQKAVWSFDHKGLSHLEIAKILNTSYGNARQIYSRAKKRLKQCVEQHLRRGDKED